MSAQEKESHDTEAERKRKAARERYYRRKLADPEYIRRISRAASRRYREKNRDRINKKQREFLRNNPEIAQERVRRMRAKFPEKNRARILLADAIYRGKMQKKPCEVCGERKVHAHHFDYSKPLAVVWLCHKHHEEIHHGAAA